LTSFLVLRPRASNCDDQFPLGDQHLRENPCGLRSRWLE